MNNLHLRDGKVEFRWKRWRNKKRQEVSYCLMVLFSGAVLLGGGGMALAGPTGGQVTSGTGTISQAGTTTTISQTSNVLDINWQTFSTAPNETVNFVQPGSTSLAINRVVGGVPSYLQGALNANGRVFILNSAGITFAGTSRVNVGALLATTAMTIDGNANQFANFSAPSGSGGSVINQGQITVSNGGFAILAAPYVQNTGFIKADLGTVALAGTNQFTLDLRGDGLINFVVPPGTAAQIVADGQKVGVDNSGTLQARSGQVIISANVATQVVNAVVNLKGVVDADAFAANGAGGTVMVTSTGDINLGGTVTAQGNGTGAGGSIVTKAGGVDNVESGANLLAAGGSAGHGGQIEVSGKSVKLDGNIVAGKGGHLLIDPLNMVIATNGTGSTPNQASINEHWLANALDHGSSITLAASNNITFKGTNPANDFVLLGNDGNLTVIANENIVFSNVKDYEIRTGSGNVHLTANHGEIGSNGGRLSIVSGFGTDNPGLGHDYTGVTQAGDVVLKAGTNIFLDNVTVKTVDGASHHLHASFSADAQHGNIDIAGAVDVEASANGESAAAVAHVNLFAPDHIGVNGPVSVLANAHGFGDDIQASAQLIAAQNYSHVGSHWDTDPAGSIHFGNAITVEARANGTTDPTSVDAVANVLLAADDITVTGNATVKATASASFVDHVKANAILIAEDSSTKTADGDSGHDFQGAASNINFAKAIDVEAKANGSHVDSSVEALGSVELFATNIHVHGTATVKATASNSSDAPSLVTATAKLTAAEGASSNYHRVGAFTFHSNFDLKGGSGADVTFNGPIDVEARAFGSTVEEFYGVVRAKADVHLVASDQIYVGGNVTVFASATGHGSDSRAASVNADAGFTAVGGEVTHYNFFNGSGSHQHLICVTRTPASTVFLDPALTVQAEAHGHDVDLVTANAHAVMAATGSVRVDGNAAILATANGFNADSLEARATLTVEQCSSARFTGSTYQKFQNHFLTDRINFFRGIDISAKVSGSATDSLDASAVGEFYGRNVDFGGQVNVLADASVDGDANFVGANAALLVEAASPLQISTVGTDILDKFINGFQHSNSAIIHFHNGIDVEAHAHGVCGFVDNAAASANVVLDGAHITVDGKTKVSASATATDASYIRADARLLAQLGQASFATAGTVDTRCGAPAFAGSVNGTIHVGANDVTFGNSVTVDAFAHGRARDVTANASGHLAGFAVNVEGLTTVTATADNTGDGRASANAMLLVDYVDANVGALANNLSGVEEYLGSHGLSSVIDTLASYIGHGSNAVEVELSAHIGGSNMQLAGFHVGANAQANDATFDSTIRATALATLAGNLINVSGPASVDATANALDFHDPGVVEANAKLVTDLIGIDATVQFGAISGSPSSFHPGPSNQLAIDAHLGGGFSGHGETRFVEGFNVSAFAHAEGASAVYANATALLLTEDLDVFAPGDVTATAVGTFDSEVVARSKMTVGELALTLTSEATGRPGIEESTVLINVLVGGNDESFQQGFNVQAHAHGFSVDGLFADAGVTLAGASSDAFIGAFSGFGGLGAFTAAPLTVVGGGNVRVGGPAIVNATADGVDLGVVQACATLTAEGGEISTHFGFDNSHNNITSHFAANSLNFGSVDVRANTVGQNVFDFVDASGVGQFYARDVNMDGPVTVKGSAAEFTIDGFRRPDVQANAFLFAADRASSFHDRGTGSSVRNHSLIGSGAEITFNQSIDVEAHADAGRNAYTVNAFAGVELAADSGVHVAIPVASADSGDITLKGNVTVLASASAQGTYSRRDDRVHANGVFVALGSSFWKIEDGTDRFDSRQIQGGKFTLAKGATLAVEANAFGHHLTGSVDGSAGAFFDVSTLSAAGLVTVLADAHGTSVEAITADAQLRTDPFLVNFAGGFDVEANANGHHVTFVVDATADASIDGVFVKVGGPGIVLANAHGSTVDGVEARSRLGAHASDALSFASGFDVEAHANGHHVLFAVDATADGSLRADSSIAVKGLAKVLASANGSTVDGVRADAQITTDPVHLTFSNGFDVEAHANGQDVLFSVEAFANASLDASYVNVKGVGKVVADAHGSTADGVVAQANLFTDPVTLTFATGFDVEADATGHNIRSSVVANATAHIFADVITVGGPAVLKAHASGSNSTDFGRNLARVTAFANLDASASSMSFSAPRGQRAIDVEANANGFQVRNEVDAIATADLFGRVILVKGPAHVQATANYSQSIDGSPFAVRADARLLAAGRVETCHVFTAGSESYGFYLTEPASFIDFGGGISVTALTHGSYAWTIQAGADARLVADNIAVGGGVEVMGTATGHNANEIRGSAHFIADGFSYGAYSFGSRSHRFFLTDVLDSYGFYEPASHVTVTGGLDDEAHAMGQSADGLVVDAEAGLIADQLRVAGLTKVRASASGNRVYQIDADAEFIADENGSESFQGAIDVRAVANVGSEVEYANAFASVDLDASGNITVFGPGGFGPGFAPAITVVASADPQHHARHARATASLAAEAGVGGPDFSSSHFGAHGDSYDPATRGSRPGNLLIIGNVTARSLALGSSAGNEAFSELDLEGDGVTVVGNIRSLAHADSIVGDRASAEVEIYALANGGGITLIETQDPIASAIGGSAHAFRQAHFSTYQSATAGAHGSHAYADIDIQAGPSSSGGVTVLTPTTDQQLRLQTLTDIQPNPPWASSSLSEIPLSIDHHDCGVLGGAGNPNAKPKGCERGPFDISETDELP